MRISTRRSRDSMSHANHGTGRQVLRSHAMGLDASTEIACGILTAFSKCTFFLPQQAPSSRVADEQV